MNGIALGCAVEETHFDGMRVSSWVEEKTRSYPNIRRKAGPIELALKRKEKKGCGGVILIRSVISRLTDHLNLRGVMASMLGIGHKTLLAKRSVTLRETIEHP